MDFLRADDFFDLGAFEHRALFSGTRYVWEGLGNISAVLREAKWNVRDVACFAEPLSRTVLILKGRVVREGFEILGGDALKGTFRVRIGGEETTEAVVLFAGAVLMDEFVSLGSGTVVEPGALIKGPTIIGSRTEIRQGAYMRGKCIVGDRCVVGHTTEIKSSIMLNDAKAGHFAYIGDSILGNFTNLGAGTKLANLKVTPGSVIVKARGESIDTGLRKFGAVLGDHVEIGCNTVTNPGTLLGKNAVVFPVCSVRSGYHEPRSVLKGNS